jgi:hypothetical protein
MPYFDSERCFRRYEPAIAIALERFPECICFKTARATSTDHARCVDAITYFKVNRWKIDDPVRAARFENLVNGVANLRVWIEQDAVCIGPAALSPKRRIRPVTLVPFTLPDISSTTPERVYHGSEISATACITPVNNRTAIVTVPRDEADVLTLIDLIDNAVVTVPFCLPSTYLPIVEQHCADRLNVVFNVVNDSIIIQ